MLMLFENFGWMSMLMLSFFGTGSYFSASILRIRLSLGINILLGIALFHVIGSSLMAIYPFPMKYPFIAWVVVGCLLAFSRLLQLKTQPIKWKIKLPSLIALSLISISFLGTTFLALCNQETNIADDKLVYIPFSKMILQTGNFADPFSLRRMAAFGGQSLLHAILNVVVISQELRLLELVFFVPLFIILLLKWCPKKGIVRYSWMLLIAILVWYEPPRMNLAAQLSAMVLYAGIIQAITEWNSNKEQMFQWAVCVGLIAASFVSLRAHFLPTVFIFFLSLMAISGLEREKIKFNLMCLIFTLLFIMPWSVLLWKSSKSIWFPLFYGNYNAAMGTFSSANNARTGLEQVQYLIWNRQLYLWFSLPFLAYYFNLKKSLLIASCLTSLSVTLAFCVTQKNISDVDIYRYCHPILFVTILQFLSKLGEGISEYQSRFPLQALRTKSFTVFVLLSLLTTDPLSFWHRLTEMKTMANELTWKIKLRPLEIEKQRLNYYFAQEQVPEGARILSAVNDPYFFDYRRNTIHHVDIPENVSPNRELSFNDYSTAKDYLNRQSIHYFIYEDPTKAKGIYSAEFWNNNFFKKTPPRDYHKDWYPHFLALFNFYNELKQRKNIIYSANAINVAKF